MTRKSKPLVDVFAELLKSRQPSALRLPRGLALAYTPGQDESALPKRRLVTSRPGSQPSTAEDRIVLAALRKALAALNRRTHEGVAMEPNQTLGLNGRMHGATIYTWQEVPPASVPRLLPTDGDQKVTQ